eukprot:gene34340-3630_t
MAADDAAQTPDRGKEERQREEEEAYLRREEEAEREAALADALRADGLAAASAGVARRTARRDEDSAGCEEEARAVADRRQLEDDGVLVKVEREVERAAVARLLAASLAREPQVSAVYRVQNKGTYSRFGGAEGYTATDLTELLFHGCRTLANEVSIVREGFSVACARSGRGGGVIPGTWFAYGAAYSDAGYAAVGADGEKHLFVCQVRGQRLLDNPTMTVVPEDRAYPHYLVHYR